MQFLTPEQALEILLAKNLTHAQVIVAYLLYRIQCKAGIDIKNGELVIEIDRNYAARDDLELEEIKVLIELFGWKDIRFVVAPCGEIEYPYAEYYCYLVPKEGIVLTT